MIHLIDIYVGADSLPQNGYFKNRYERYINTFIDASSGFDSKSSSPCALQDFAFAREFVTNPDSVMCDWRKIAPDLHDVREKTKLCTLLLHVVKN